MHAFVSQPLKLGEGSQQHGNLKGHTGKIDPDNIKLLNLWIIEKRLPHSTGPALI